jgi:hypothetical protein
MTKKTARMTRFAEEKWQAVDEIEAAKASDFNKEQ